VPKVDALASALLRAPFKPKEWMTALELLASATNSNHCELIGGKRPNKATLKLISNLSDSDAKLIREWEQSEGADPARNPIIGRGVRTPILEVVSDEEIISRDDRKHHRVWNEFYNKLDIPHICFVPLWRDRDQAHLGLSLLRSFREGPIQSDQRKIFTAAAYAWYNAAAISRAVKDDGARVLAGAFDELSIAAIILDGFGRCATVTPAAEAHIKDGRLLRLRLGAVELSKNLVAKAACVLASRVISIDSTLEPCVSCLVRSGVSRRSRSQQSCSISIHGPRGRAAHLRLAPLPRDDYDLGFGPAAMIIVEKPGSEPRLELAPEVAALLTPAESQVALDLLRGQRPAEIAMRRRVSIETVRSQLKRIYAKNDASSAIEFLAKARR
jgi:DNA-binding CsgD family transcriptional regulator